MQRIIPLELYLTIYFIITIGLSVFFIIMATKRKGKDKKILMALYIILAVGFIITTINKIMELIVYLFIL